MDSIIRFFQEGGAFMYPIAVVMAIGLAIAIERLLYLSRERSANRNTFEEILPMLESRDMRAALNYANESNSKLGNIFSAAIARIPGSQRREEIEYALEEGLMEALPQLEKRTQYIATLANIATLMGLLGTIMGLIAAFTAVANAAPAEKAALLSQSISVAMNTTAFGLIASIPLLLLHTYLQTKTNEIIDSLEMAGVKFLNIITERKQAPATAAK
ncbi:MotA/TolQ/ExbB proton channel family protein [Parathalassolituus penaei]|uniref:MotA/TolQ/ExbB proton channel family protein n=1 Tax=Parathalassolituus penaei TaxID=2997323 RepID=A0A9X3EDH9_9GAMM|nr:MotA/TolQ/ExbB proton channel family protein [Parathalassolituus penaei]MCY0965612.1 MotA/TolQ/ExbB proton channel family protein [Parathalassolituus penaei]